MEIINSNKNTNKLCFDGYMYVIKYTGKDKITWRCDKSSKLKCPGTIYTDIAQTKILELGHPHLISHPANQIEINVTKCYNEMKTEAKTNKTNPVEIYAEGVSKMNNETKSQIPQDDTVKRTLRNQRNKDNPSDHDEITGK